MTYFDATFHVLKLKKKNIFYLFLILVHCKRVRIRKFFF